MQEHLNENTLFNTVAMLLKDVYDRVLVVEGPDDHLLLKRHVPASLTIQEATSGRPQVLGAARIAKRLEADGAIFLIDRDYDDFIDSQESRLDNVLVSDFHDCFVDLMFADDTLLSHVIDVLTKSERRGDNRRPIPHSSILEEQSISIATAIAANRIVSLRRELSLDFKKLGIGNLKLEDCNPVSIAKILIQRSDYFGGDEEDIFQAVQSAHDEISVLHKPPVGDHDLFAAVSRVLRFYGVSVGVKQVQDSYLLAADGSSLQKTSWFPRLVEWSGFDHQFDDGLVLVR